MREPTPSKNAASPSPEREIPGNPSPGGQVAIVTGGSRGIGLAITQALLGRGMKVWFCARDAVRVKAAELELGSGKAGRVEGRSVDVGDAAAVHAFVAEVKEREGRIDVLVNNAGSGFFRPVDQIGTEEWRRLMAANLDGPFFFTRAVAPTMREQGSGFIVNIASLAGKASIAGGAAYNASKFALVGFSDACMLDLRADGIRVSVVMPGSVDTHFFDQIRDDSPGSEARGHMLRPADVARAVTDLLDYPAHALPSRLELRPVSTGR
ncbi:MAG: SDR family NAD(P)-dependent oxidoreductase [Holophagales bacterium]|nr:SDR family NAD(P)-dependent oxidoreductase [Holophagales bacterium]